MGSAAGVGEAATIWTVPGGAGVCGAGRGGAPTAVGSWNRRGGAIPRSRRVDRAIRADRYGRDLALGSLIQNEALTRRVTRA